MATCDLRSTLVSVAEVDLQLTKKTVSAINKNTTYLVVGNNTGKTKLEKANRLGVETLTEEQFLKMIN